MATTLVALFCHAPASGAQDWAAKLPVGSTFPVISAKDQTGRTLDNSSLHGSNGMLFVFVRSTNW